MTLLTSSPGIQASCECSEGEGEADTAEVTLLRPGVGVLVPAWCRVSSSSCSSFTLRSRSRSCAIVKLIIINLNTMTHVLSLISDIKLLFSFMLYLKVRRSKIFQKLRVCQEVCVLEV